jgi:predicted O-methyltransferase YrrM
VLSIPDIQRLDAIEGHLNYREGMTLFAFAYNATGSGRIVEIGSFKGKSTCWMATGLKLAKIENKVVAIDPHINVRDCEVVPAYNEKSSAEAFCHNLTRLGLRDYVQPVCSTSKAAEAHWSEPISLLFIDGSHRYEDVLDDLTLWVPWVERGGVVCMHDTAPGRGFIGVHHALEQYTQKNTSLIRVMQLGNMTVLRKSTE